MKREGTAYSTSGVNLLANLIRWVSVAKRDVGADQLPIFLDTYAIGEPVSAELRDGIVRLAQVVGEAAGEPDKDMASAWSRLILELHGIVTGGGSGPSHGPEPLFDLGDEARTDTSDTDENGQEEATPIQPNLTLPEETEAQDRQFIVALASGTDSWTP